MKKKNTNQLHITCHHMQLSNRPALTDNDQAFLGPRQGDVDLMLIGDEAEMFLHPALGRVPFQLVTRQRAHSAQDNVILFIPCGRQ